MLARRTIVGMRWMLMLGAHVRSPAGEGLREVVRGWERFGCSLLGVFLQPRYQFMSVCCVRANAGNSRNR